MSKQFLDFVDKNSLLFSQNKTNSNLLILLPGIGDIKENFINFGKKLELPQTSLLCLNGFIQIPYFDGFSWFNSFDCDGNCLLLFIFSC